MNRASSGVAYAAAASLTWGTVFFAARGLVDKWHVDPWFLTAARFTVGAAFLLGYVALKGRLKELVNAFRSPGRLIVLGVTGVFMMGTLVSLAVMDATAAASGVLMNANAVFILVMAPFFGEAVSSRKIVAVAVGLAGVMLVIVGFQSPLEVFSASGHGLRGQLLATGASFSWAMYTVLGRKSVKEHGGLITTTGAMCVGAVICCVAAVAARAQVDLSPRVVGSIAYIAIIPTGLGFVWWYMALERVGAARIGPLQFLAPVFTALLAWIFLGERVGAGLAVGALLIFAALVISVRDDRLGAGEGAPEST